MALVKPSTLLALVFVMLTNGAVWSQDRALPTEADMQNAKLFRAFFASAGHRARVEDTIRAEERRLSPECPAVTVEELADFHPYGPVDFSDTLQLQSGLWLEVWDVKVCGRETRRSVLFTAKNGDLKAIPFLPGRTNVDPVLGRDLLPRTNVSARLYVGQETGQPCTDAPQLFDTELVMLPRDARVDIDNAPADVAAYLKENVSEVWRENWYFRACGHIAEVKIMFMINNEGGTTFNLTKGAVTPAS